MATIPVYRTWVAGEIVTALEMNGNIRDAGIFWLAKPFCNVYNNAGVSCVNNTLTLCPWDTELEDNDNMHNPASNPSRVIAQTIGLFLVNTALSWNANNALIDRVLMTRLNAAGASGGGTLVNRADSASASTGAASLGNSSIPQSTFFYRMVNIGDYLEVFAEQVSGGTVLTTAGASTYFQMGWWNA